MKLSCDLDVTYSKALTACVPTHVHRSSKSRASICLGKKGSAKKEELYLSVITAKNVSGTSYKVRDNIIQVFSKFVGEGKATIKFKEPAHDLCISKADPTKLKEILSLLKMAPSQHPADTPLLVPPKVQDIERPKKCLVIRSRSEYPTEGFPGSIETLQAVGILLNRVDLRILQLKHLQSLDLSENHIKTVPDGICDIGLMELKLSGNKLTELSQSFCTGELAKCLRLLDLSRNELDQLPTNFFELKGLVTLKVDCNKLQFLPRLFGKLDQLKFLSASNNKLSVLPATFSRLSLESLDLFGNPFRQVGLVRRCSDLSLPSLLELSGRVVKKHKIPYCPYSLPVVLCHYLDAARRCVCGNACFTAFLQYIASLDMHKISATVTAIDTHGTTTVPVEAFLCSAKCLKLWRC